MNENTKTALFAAAALLLVVVALLATPGSPSPELLASSGPLFDLAPEDVASLEVIGYDAETEQPIRFQVERRQRVWRIPSHYNYPADNTDQVATVAAALVGLQPEALRSVSRADHEVLGVVDPADESAASPYGRGTRLTLRSEDNRVLADIIIGNRVEEGSSRRFVRKPESPHTYQATLPSDFHLTTNFADWIETDLLHLNEPEEEEGFGPPVNRPHQITFDNYTVNLEQRGGALVPVIHPAEQQLVLRRQEDNWLLEGLAEGEQTNTTTVTDLVSALDALRILDVQPKPEGVGADLTLAEGRQLPEELFNEMAVRGFFFSQPEGKPQLEVVSNQGELRVATDDGLRYTLRFGQLAQAEGTVELDADGQADSPDVAQAAGGRYLIIGVAFDEALIDEFHPAPEPPTPQQPAAQSEAPTEPAAETETPAQPAAQDEATAEPTGHTQLPAEPTDQREAPAESQGQGGDTPPDACEPPAETSPAQDPPPPGQPESPADPAPDDPQQPDDPTEAPQEPAAPTEDSAPQAEQHEPAHDASTPPDDAAPEPPLGLPPELQAPEETPEQRYERELADWQTQREQRAERGRRRARDLQQRFADWYYVIADESFNRIRLTREQLVTVPAAQPTEPQPATPEPAPAAPEPPPATEQPTDGAQPPPS